MSDPKLTDCPACAESALVKKISAVSFRLKGSGWYETDFKSGDKRQLHEDADASKAKSDSNGKEDSKTKESKADKADSKSSTKSNKSKSESSTQSATSP